MQELLGLTKEDCQKILDLICSNSLEYIELGMTLYVAISGQEKTKLLPFLVIREMQLRYENKGKDADRLKHYIEEIAGPNSALEALRTGALMCFIPNDIDWEWIDLWLGDYTELVYEAKAIYENFLVLEPYFLALNYSLSYIYFKAGRFVREIYSDWDLLYLFYKKGLENPVDTYLRIFEEVVEDLYDIGNWGANDVSKMRYVDLQDACLELLNMGQFPTEIWGKMMVLKGKKNAAIYLFDFHFPKVLPPQVYYVWKYDFIKEEDKPKALHELILEHYDNDRSFRVTNPSRYTSKVLSLLGKKEEALFFLHQAQPVGTIPPIKNSYTLGEVYQMERLIYKELSYGSWGAGSDVVKLIHFLIKNQSATVEALYESLCVKGFYQGYLPFIILVRKYVATEKWLPFQQFFQITNLNNRSASNKKFYLECWFRTEGEEPKIEEVLDLYKQIYPSLFRAFYASAVGENMALKLGGYFAQYPSSYEQAMDCFEVLIKKKSTHNWKSFAFIYIQLLYLYNLEDKVLKRKLKSIVRVIPQKGRGWFVDLVQESRITALALLEKEWEDYQKGD